MTFVSKFLNMLRKLHFVTLAIILGSSWISKGQSYYSMSSGNYSQNFSDLANWTNNYAAGTGANNWRVATSVASSTLNTFAVFVTGVTGGVQKGTENLILLATGTNATGTDLLLNFSNRNAGTISLDWTKVTNTVNVTPRSSDLKIQYSTDNGSTFTDLTGYTIPRVLNNNDAESGSLTNISLPAALNNQSQVVIRFFVWNNGQTGGSGNRPKIAIDNVSVTSTASSTPTIITSTSSLTGFSAVTGNNSTSQSFTVRGTNVTERIVLTAPTGFQVSRDNSTFQDTVHTAFVVDSVPTQTIHVRQTSATLGTTSGNVSCTSAGATAVNVSVAGVVLSTEPTTQPTLTIGTITTSTIELSIGNTAGLSNWIVVAREGSAVNGVPVDGTNYTANATFSSGAVINTNNRVVLKGNGTSLTVTVPNPATVYHFAVYSFNDGGVTASTNYNTTSAGTANATTLAVPLGWQINATNSLFTINFDATVANVNNGAFTAPTTFAASNPSAGQLNSNAWAYNPTSGGAATFGGNLTSGFGTSTGGVTSGGTFAFEVSSGNVALGFQPTGSVLNAGGHLTLRIQNKTGAVLNNVQLGYILWVNNNEARSTTIGFSHSTDNSTYTAVTDNAFNSVEASQGSVLWVPQYYSVSLSSLNIAADGFFYLRWTGTDLGGSGSRDEFAIDDISFIAERSSTNLSTSGNFENMLIDGNVTLSAASSAFGVVTLKSGVLASAGNLTLRSTTATRTGRVSGGTNTSITGNVTVERFLPWQSANNNGFRFVGHPLRSNPVINTVTNLPVSNNTLIGYNEAQNAYVGIADRNATWPQGTAYGVWTSATNTLSFTGELQLSDVSPISLTRSSQRWHYLANPFPSVLDWNAVSRTDVLNAVYVWEKDNSAEGSGAWGSFIDGVSANNGGRYLAPGQGFMVRTADTGSPSITFPAAARSTASNPSYYRQQNVVGDVFRVRVAKPANQTGMETVIRFRNQATASYDAAYDAEFLTDWMPASPDLYTTDANGQKYSIQALPALGNQTTFVPLGLETFGAGAYTFTFDASGMVSPADVRLEDLSDGSFTQVMPGQPITISTGVQDAPGRFVLHFNSLLTTSVKGSDELAISIYTHEGALYVNGLERGDVRITDLSGRTVYQQAGQTFGEALRPALAKGAYLVQVNSAAGSKFVKVIF